MTFLNALKELNAKHTIELNKYYALAVNFTHNERQDGRDRLDSKHQNELNAITGK